LPAYLSAIAAGTSTDGFVINGESAYDYSGHSVSNAGDVNGDGLDDLIVGASTVSLRVTVTIILSPILSVLVLPVPVAFVARIATLLTLVCMIASKILQATP
jgi:hypothetical protein